VSGAAHVFNLIAKRAAAGSRPGARADAHRLGLVIEGGVMRGVVTAGMVTALESLGLRDVFDVIYGASAGAFNGAYFLAGQAAFGTTIYYQNLNRSDFIRFERVLRGRPLANLDVILERIIVEEKPLDWHAVINAPIPLKVVASSLDRLTAVTLEGFRDRATLFAALRASANMPIVAGPPTEVAGERLVDASLFEPVPLPTALRDGCTHVLVLLSRPSQDAPRRLNLVERRLVPPRLEKLRSGLGEIYVKRLDAYQATLRTLAESTSMRPPFLASIACASGTREVGRLERDAARLRDGARHGMESALSRLCRTRFQVVETLTTYGDRGQPLRRGS
jgi:predicted patatin/cPLA2 family phospholipase